MANVLKLESMPGAEPNFTAGEKTLVWPWKAELDGATDNPYKDIVDRNLGQILLGAHPNYPDLYLLRVHPHMPDPSVPNFYIVDFHYSNRVPWDDGAVKDGNKFIYQPQPWKEPMRITRSFYTTTKNMLADLDNKLFQTTANEVIFHQQEVQYRCWLISKKLAKIPDCFRTTVKNGSAIYINSDSIILDGETYPKYTLQIRDIELQPPELQNSWIYYLFTAKIMYNPETWMVKKRNAGYLAIQRFRVMTPNGNGKSTLVSKLAPIKVGVPPQFPTHPIPLDAKGRIYPGFSVYDQTTTKAGPVLDSIADVTDAKYLKRVYDETQLTFRTYNTIAFTGNVPLK